MGQVTDYVRLIESLIRLDRKSEAAREIRKCLEKGTTRALVAPLARLARQTGLSALGVRTLHPIVRGEAEPTPAEIAEYAACLTGIGATSEALALIAGLDPSVRTDALLFKACALAREWNHDAAGAAFASYLETPGLDVWHRWEAEFARVQALLGSLALGRATEILQEALRGHELDSYPALRHQGERLARKVGVYSALLSDPRGKKARDDWRALRDEAERAGDWETVRESDLVRARATGDQELLTHVFFGTPWPGFRKSVTESQAILPDEYLWKPRPEEPKTELLDILTGRPTPRGGRLKIGQVLHRLLVGLVGDFYGPIPIALLHAKLYPEETYHPAASPARLHEAVKRLRLWFRENELPLTVEEQNGGYRLVATAPVSIRIPHPDRLRERNPLLIERLQESWRDTPFSVRDASEALGVSSRSALRILAEAQKRGLIRRVGQSRAVRYHFMGDQ